MDVSLNYFVLGTDIGLIDQLFIGSFLYTMESPLHSFGKILVSMLQL